MPEVRKPPFAAVLVEATTDGRLRVHYRGAALGDRRVAVRLLRDAALLVENQPDRLVVPGAHPRAIVEG